MIRPLRCLGALLIVSAPCLAATETPWTQRDLDHGVVAVRSAHAPSPEARAVPIADWWLVPNDGPRTAQGVVEAAQRALEDGATFATPVLVGEDGGPVWPTSDLLVGLDARHRGEAGRAFLADVTGGRVEWRYPEANVFRVELDLAFGPDVLGVCDELAHARPVVFAEPDLLVTGGGSGLPNDPEFANLWALENTGQFSGTPGIDLGALEAWALSTGSSEVPVVVIDVGVDPTHPDLNLLPGKDFTSDAPGAGQPRNTCDLHGTLVAGTICARKDNAEGVVGIAPDSPVVSARCFVASTPVCTGAWFARTSWTADALHWSNAQGYRITNNSNFYNNPSQAVEALYGATRAAGMVHFASAGNSGAQGLTWPARVDEVVSVGAYGTSGARGSFSNFGPKLDLMAPGELIRTTDLPGAPGLDPGDYKFTVGTSVASPYVAGVAALLLTREPALSPAEVEARLIAGSVDMDAPGRDDLTGHGRVFAPHVLVPCALPDTVCATSPNSAGAGAVLLPLGAASLGSGQFALEVTGGVPNEVGMFFYGPDVQSVPFDNGVLCAAPGGVGFARVGDRERFDGTGHVSGVFDLGAAPFNAGPAAWTLGTSWTVQFYYRDLAGGGSGRNLSDAVRVTVCP